MPSRDAPAEYPSGELRDLAVAVALEAADLLSGVARGLAGGAGLEVASKSSATDPVSEADRAAERLIAARLATARPEDGLLGEEGQASRTGSSGLTWVVDPLDGTVNFLYGNPAWCVSIAAVDAEGTLVGVVHDAARNETFHAVRGAGAWLRRHDGAGDVRLGCTHVDQLSATLVATGFAYDPLVRAGQGHDVAALLAEVRDVRRTGSAALDLCWCAAGRTDAYLEFGVQYWDWAAGVLLVAEAGGSVTHPVRTYAGREVAGVLAAGPAAHRRLTRWLETPR